MGLNLGFFHFHLRKRIHQKHEKYPHPEKFRNFYDKLIYFVAFATPITNLPQLFEVWYSKSAQGVSFISWTMFAVISVTWLIYGIIHKEKPIIFMNALLIIVQSLIAIGAFVYG